MANLRNNDEFHRIYKSTEIAPLARRYHIFASKMIPCAAPRVN
jgi:hypothetical protein